MKVRVFAILIVTMSFSGIPVGAQTPAGQSLAFDAATVKRNMSAASGWSSDSTNGLLRITNATMQSLITYAFDVRDFQISGGPGWLTADRYDITGKPESGAHDAQMKEMLRTLLAERFQLQTHRETKNGSVYALVVARSGMKLEVTKSPNHRTSHTSADTDGKRTFHAEGFNMDELAASLAAILRQTVVDRTGDAGKYDFELSWMPDPGTSNNAVDSSGPSIFTALQEQLGLRLESQKGPIPILVIDRIERPSEN
jgi:uncharacterized protein (TIGR03435 family)